MNADQCLPPRRRAVPLGERPTSAGPAPETELELEPASEAAGVADEDRRELVGPGRRHVWVSPADGAGAAHAGLVHAWRRASSGEGWEARCTYVVEDGSPEGVTVTQWLAASVVSPAG